MRVVATAGHVDHGKSTLIRALTGMEPDRWAEERRRGMTIDLGFAWTTLPGLAEPVAFVDVPGHERFVTQMLAGVGPVPATMFVVAADEGWMPQSGEHLDALHALGVRHGLLVVTRSDLADPELARDEALEHLAESSLGRLPAVCVSGATGEGLDELRTALVSLVEGLPAPDRGGDVRLWVDRAFTIRGAGTVVTGTLGGGRIAAGDELVLAGADGDRPVTVRGLQALGAPVEAAEAVSRVAVNLRGVPLEALSRGDALLTPGRWLATSVVDVRLHPPRGTGARSADDALPAQVMLHVGSAAVAARVRPLSRADAPDAGAEPGTRTLRLTLRVPLPLRPGDRALLRDPGAHAVLGGVTVLDVRPPELRRRGAARSRAAQLAGTSGAPDPAAELHRRKLLRIDDLAGLGLAGAPPDAPGLAGWLVDPEHLDALAGRLVDAVAEHARADPLDPGLPARAAARALELPEPRLLALVLARPPASDDLTEEGGRILRRGDGGLPPAVRTALAEVAKDLASSPFAAPDADRLAELGLGAKQLGAAVRAGELLRVADGVYLLPDGPDRAVEVLATLEQPFTVSAARQALGTTRRVAVPLLELLARTGRTRHEGGAHSVRM
ncbi:selenocysteine-specific translation elongation factor [Actinomycetospora sp. TBRC 11914]|uniref:selenocysteine-specific translation elongation factor n=1 Tax=Actinomycetospora sp. TBRC 11914 TaxID=2729387 RepID=UPI00145DFA07|nr:selenocysteine-specific translation elongation factor [Actinomycetospora sp. TBRC 11914]NMO88171.1 selenocysteine-specific translation elongation factor [Actinomycetospora sp. TBRC 11914]